ncbi:MAG: ATP-binding protein [Candidatus Cloacimonetes bacterium]|nr:ATP-binding protein [Candidatus Cloacimonadota bacterium]
MKRKINIRPTTGVYSTYKRLSYQPWTAIAEFVDNSTQSFYDNKERLFQTKYYKKLIIEIEYIEDEINGDSLVIKDNAYGMEWDDFERAVILDRPPRNTNGRNEFGMGLKTAACWFGNWWSVESTQLNSPRKYYAEMDIDILEKYKNEEIEVIEEPESPKQHYTIITIKKLNKKIKGARTKAKVKELLSSLYRVDLRSGLIEITVTYNGNSSKLSFVEPQVYEESFSDGTIKRWKQPVNFFIEADGNRFNVNGFIAIRSPGSLRDAGFTLIRRGRVIIGGPECNYRPHELFGDINSFPYQRLYGELHMDNWKVTQAKDDFDWHNSGLEETFISKLLEFTKEYKTKAEQIRVREKVVTNDIIKKVSDDLRIPGLIDNLKIEVLDPSIAVDLNIGSKENPKQDDKEGEGIILEGSSAIKINLEYKKIKYVFDIKYEMNSPSSQWLTLNEIKNDYYELKINMKHPFFKPLIDNKEFITLMTKFVMAMVLAEIESIRMSNNDKIDFWAIRIGMNNILEEVIKSEDTQ